MDKDLEKQLQEAVDETLRIEAQIGTELRNQLNPYFEAMLRASGLTDFQAKTCVYYALASLYLYKFATMPLLVFLGRTATGKSAAMIQLKRILGLDANINASTYSDLAKELNELHIAMIEEADSLRPQDRCEQLLQKRTDKTQEAQIVHIPPGQSALTIKNFGATITHRRGGFDDVATRNRSIVIKTRPQVGYWELSTVNAEHFRHIAALIDIEDSSYTKQAVFSDKVANRIFDTWQPIITIAGACYDSDYLKEVKIEITKDIRSTVADDEPLDIAAKALLATYYEGKEFDCSHNVKLRDVARSCEENLAIRKSTQWLKSNLRELGYEVSFYMGYDHIKPNEAVTKQLKERLEG